MRKNFKILICMVLVSVMSFAMTGCALFEHNYKKDYQQVIATIGVDTTEKIVDGEKKTFKTDKKTIYKADLVNSVKANAQNLMSQYQMTLEQAVQYLMDDLVYTQLIQNEIDKLFYFGDLVWTQADKNAVTKSVYGWIDSQLTSIKKAILKGEGVTVPADPSDSKTETTYPIPDAEEPEEDENPEKWAPDVNKYPAMFGDFIRKSREREMVRRFVDFIKAQVKDDFKMTADEKKYIDADIKKLDELVKSEQIEKIYPLLFDADYDPKTGEGNGTYILEYLVGKNARNNQRESKLEKQLTDDVQISDEELSAYYDTLLASQKASFETKANYDKAVTEGKTTILYTPDSNYFYVKHILVEFSAEQKADLKAYTDSGLHTKKEVEAYRAQLVNEIVAYPHVDGENDTTRRMSAKQVFNVINDKMSPLKYNPREAERMFDSLTYEYNMDKGAFGSATGYAVAYKLAEGESETYMQEFADAARKMYDSIEVGQVLNEMVITDYGVHFMYLASKTTRNGVKDISDYQTPAENKLIKDVLSDELKANKEAAAFESWRNEKITYYEKVKKIVERKEKVYKDLYEAK